MMRSLIHKLGILTGGALLAATQGAGAVTISQVPLFISSGVTPNVMLFVDNSGSMDNIIWADAFNNTVAYPDWSPTVSGSEVWTTGSGNVSLSTLLTAANRGTCGSSFARGVNTLGTVTKCLRLPDSVGGNGTRYTGNYLNYLFQTYANNTDLRGGQIPLTHRMQVARNVATNLVTNYPSMRIGLSSFNSSSGGDTAPGGRINAVCGSTQATLLTQIAALNSSTWTPLAEALYEITRYFRGLSGYYNSTSYTSPIQYRCQANFAVIITDGLPTYDNGLPVNDPADVADTSRSLPNWDGKAPLTTQIMYPNFPQYSDGFQVGAQSQEGFTLYLDDVAKFGQDIDFKTSGNDLTGASYNAVDFPKQNLITYTVGFAADNQMLEDAAEYGTGFYYSANNEAQLLTALNSAFQDIIDRSSTAAAVATNSTRLASDTLIYQGRFSSIDWGGSLFAFPLDSEGVVGALAWDAADLIPAPASRKIYTYDPTAAAGSRGKTFLYASLNKTQQSDINRNAAGKSDANGPARVDYVRGVRTNEAPAGLQFRKRSSVLGDIINSDPAYAYRQNFGFEILPGAEGSSYKTFRSSAPYTTRPSMLYVAANDGMLHGFNAQTGVEVMAYVPNPAIAKLPLTTEASFISSHKLVNDGSPKVLDAYISGAWKTILVGNLGGGGKGVYALDVTNPTAFGTSNVMWEFTSTNDSDLGDQVPQPTIARLNNGKWAAIVSNGYNSGGQRAVLFVLDLANGAVLAELNTTIGSDNGLSAATPVDVDGDRITDYVYAGDLKGNLWKFDLSSSSSANWKIAFGTSGSPLPLWTACAAAACTSTNRQPITARPEVGINPAEGFMVYFGTGQYFAVGDNTPPAVLQSFYGIRDRNTKDTAVPAPPTGGRATLVQQQVIFEQAGRTFYDKDSNGNIIATYTEGVRGTTKNPITDTQNGWYIDLPTTGERQVSTPILRGGKVIFTTVIPSGDACGAGGDSWLMEIDALSGGRLDYTPFDLNRDHEFNSEDFITFVYGGQEITVPASGRKSKEGVIDTPGVVMSADGDTEYKYAGGSAGGLDTTIENAGEQRGRQSWRQVQ